ncbi:hypothetical protein PVAP13_3NG177090, partial [Panicum virgatum]
MEASEVAAMVGRVAERLYAEDYDEYNGIAEESVAEVMSWFELEIRLAAGAAVLPLPPRPPTPPGAALYATVGGGRESCGPSLSGPASTVMASVDGRAGAPPPPAVPWPWPFPESAAGNDDDDEEEDADDDDEWVSQLLTDGPALEGL